MSDIFISHAVADKALADKFVAFLKEAIGVPAKSIFCSSINGHNIPLGSDFNEYMRNQIQKPQLVILLMTPRYMESWFCLMELGATWAKSHQALPIVVPPVQFSAVSSTLGLKQGWSINDDAKLIDLRAMITSLRINLEARSEHDWEKKRAAWKADLKRLLKRIAPAASISAAEHDAVREELADLKEELSGLQEVYAEANEMIEALKSAKDAVAVKRIVAKQTGFNPESRFGELLDEIAAARPKVSIAFYRNMIMDLYGKALRVDWSDQNQAADGNSAIQYNIMDENDPYYFNWDNRKLKKVSATVKALQSFLDSEDAEAFVKMQENEGRSMDVTDLEFWEENLTA